ncbi:RpiR family transcriptional regulator [Pseudomonas sp. M30-35]|nr:RpiR family transcriptional regulator [Pseudomonas sp. M30-35]
MLDSRIERLEGKLTPAERTLLAYIQANQETLVFETGATLATKSGVSPNTVSRFLRRLGYKGLKSLKEELRDDVRMRSLLNTTLIERMQQPEDLVAHLHQEVAALNEFADQLGSQYWHDIVAKVSQAERVFVCGFQTIRGLAEDFANRLALVRSGAEFLDLYSGVLGHWIDSHDQQCCVILIDVAPYADAGISFAQNCLKQNTDLVVFTDEYGIAKHLDTPNIITMKTKTGLILESTAGLTSALNVLLHCVAAQHKDQLQDRLDAYRARVESLRLYRATSK